MNMRRCLLFAYRILLATYPPVFRRRFAAEMLELAASAELSEWPLIFRDTGLAIVRCWLETSPRDAAVAPDAAHGYLFSSLGKSALPASRLLQGLVLSTVIILSLFYFGSLGYRPSPDRNPSVCVQSAQTGVSSATPPLR
jgi:hypothetical protein